MPTFYRLGANTRRFEIIARKCEKHGYRDLEGPGQSVKLNLVLKTRVNLYKFRVLVYINTNNGKCPIKVY